MNEIVFSVLVKLRNKEREKTEIKVTDFYMKSSDFYYWNTLILNMERKDLSLVISFKNFTCLEIEFQSLDDLTDFKTKVQQFDSIEKMPCFKQENLAEMWNIYDPIKEFARMGSNKNWRLSSVNKDYKVNRN